MDTTSLITTLPKAGRREWLGLATLALPVLLVSMDMTVMYLVLPAISAAFKPGSAQLLWITDIYGFLEAGLLITMGTLGDRIGRRKLLLTGAVAFALASAAAAFATSAGMLIAARGLLGIAGATLLPSILSLIRNLFHDGRQRILALGIFTTCFSAGTMLGPLAGGFLLNHFWWGSVFLMGVPVMVLFLLLGPLLLPESRDPVARPFDLVSAALSLAASLLTIYGIKQLAENGLHGLPVIFIIAGLLIGALFLRRQKIHTAPLIDIRLFKQPAFSTTLVAMFLAMFCWAGLFLYIAQHLQLVLGMDPLQAGLWTISGAAGSLVTCMLSPVVARYIRRNYVMAGSMLIMCAGIAILSQMTTSAGLTLLVTAMIFISAGCGATITLGHDVVMTTAPPQQAGSVAAITETGTTFGGALGIALLGSIGTVIYRSRMTGIIPAGVSQDAAEAAQNTLGGAMAVAGKLPGHVGGQVLTTAHEAFGQSFRFVSGICAVLMLVSAIVVVMMLRKLRKETV